MNGQNSIGKNWGKADDNFLFDQKEMSKSWPLSRNSRRP